MPQNYISAQMDELRLDHPRNTEDLQDEHIFSLVCLKFFYKNGIFENRDIYNHWTDGANDGGIDSIIADTDQDKLIFIQDKMVQNISSSQEVVDILTKMQQTVDRLDNDDTRALNAKIKRVYRSQKAYHTGDNYSNVLSVFINCDPGPDMHQNIERKINDTNSLNDYDCAIFYKSEIEEEIKRKLEPARHVEEGKVNFDHESGTINYGSDGLFINISAKSIKALFEEHKNDGLFEQNFRYYIKNKKIDDGIVSSLRSDDLEKFWYLNNGIIIGCTDFNEDGNNIKLYNFSIINGCQTATLIGTHFNSENDFYVACKIIKSNDPNFLADVAEASNSQKPILDRDLKSNRPEMRQLQQFLKQQEPKIYMKIKRGEESISRARASRLEKWQNIDNPYYGKVILSALLQRPGTARNAPSNIFKTEDVYKKIFRRGSDILDKDTIVDVLKLYNYYSEFVNHELDGRLEEGNPAEKYVIDARNVSNNGEMLIPAIIIFLIKYKKGMLDDGDMIQNLQKDNLSGPLFNENRTDTFEEDLNDLFFELIDKIVEIFQANEVELQNVTNFLKRDGKYHTLILPKIQSHFYQNRRRREDHHSIMNDLFVI